MAKTLEEQDAAGASNGSHSDQSLCNSSCLRRYGAFRDIPWRVYCKKACSANGESWSDCVEDCRALCHKDPIYHGKSFEWTAALDRSPGDRYKSRSCDKACLRGCAFRFQVAPELLAIAIPPKIERPKIQIDSKLWFDPPVSTSA